MIEMRQPALEISRPICFGCSIELTLAGDTSGIITKGIGPRPTAKDLHSRSMTVDKDDHEPT